MSQPGSVQFTRHLAKTLSPLLLDDAQALRCAEQLSAAVAAEGIRKLPHTVCGRVDFEGDIAVSMHVLHMGKRLGESVPATRLLKKGSTIVEQERQAFFERTDPIYDKLHEAQRVEIAARIGSDPGYIRHDWANSYGDDWISVGSKVGGHGVLTSIYTVSTGEIEHRWDLIS